MTTLNTNHRNDMAPKKAAKKTTSAEPEARNSSANIENALKHIKTKFGEESIMKLGERPKVNVAAISTGSLSLDAALGIGGLPRGRVVEIFGPESSGKTTLALHVIAEAQKAGGICAFVDAEHAMDPEYTKKLGVNIDDLLLSQPDTGEQALEIVDSLVRTNSIDVVVVDSVAALVPKDEIEGEMGAHHVGKQARLMSQALRKLTGSVARSKTIVIFINQIRMKIGVMFGNPETTTGGNALKFYSSIRMDIRQKEKIMKGDQVVGHVRLVKVVKNKLAPPFREATFSIIYPTGIDKESSLLDAAVSRGVVQKAGAWFRMGDKQLGQGRESTIEELKKDKNLAKTIEKELRATLK